MSAFFDALGQRARSRLGLCVGLDPDRSRMATELAGDVTAFCRGIVDATAEYAAAFKPQFAHFAALGLEQELAELIDYIHQQHPSVPVILDVKRGDIGSTAERYAVEAFARYEADAATVNPYLGLDAIEPFAKYQNKGVFVLARTSNPRAGLLQDQPLGSPLHLTVIAMCETAELRNVGYVVGATAPQVMRSIRETAPNAWWLVPGIGAQGGDLAAVVAQGAPAGEGGLLISASRAILYASNGSDWQQAANAAALKLITQLQQATDT